MSLRRLECSCHCLLTGLVLGALLWSALPSAASAQQTRTLNIRDGTVYVDGRPLADDQLPDSLNLEGVNAHYRFLGIQRPVVELRGRLFAVEDGLVPVTEEEVREQRASVILGGGTTQPAGAQRARRRAADRAARGQRQYLNAIERSSRELYERLLRERRMEQDARNLARAIRLMPEGPERRARIDTLRAMLGEIFEVKQENRRREVQRLQQQIRDLKRNLRKREQMRDRMITRHLQRLIEASPDR